MKVYRFPREYSRGFCFITVPLKNSKNTAFLSRCLKKGFQFIKKSVDYLEVLTKQSTFVLRLWGGTLFSYPFLWGCEYCKYLQPLL